MRIFDDTWCLGMSWYLVNWHHCHRQWVQWTSSTSQHWCARCARNIAISAIDQKWSKPWYPGVHMKTVGKWTFPATIIIIYNYIEPMKSENHGHHLIMIWHHQYTSTKIIVFFSTFDSSPSQPPQLLAPHANSSTLQRGQRYFDWYQNISEFPSGT